MIRKNVFVIMSGDRKKLKYRSGLKGINEQYNAGTIETYISEKVAMTRRRSNADIVVPAVLIIDYGSEV